MQVQESISGRWSLIHRWGRRRQKGGTLLWDSYELAYFDRSIDGDRSSNYKNSTRPFGIRSKILASLFGLRYSFQHAVRPNLFVNDVGFKLLHIILPANVLAGGNFTKVIQEDAEAVQKEAGTKLRSDTAVRIDFEKPRMWFGTKHFPFNFQLGAKAQSPPVTLCTTYMNDRIRLAQAARGGRLVFTRVAKCPSH